MNWPVARPKCRSFPYLPIIIASLLSLAFFLAYGSSADLSKQTGGCPAVSNTPYMTIVYGSVTIDGAPAPIGTVVEARSPRGDTVGCVQLAYSGILPLMPIYGEDASATPPIPGMRDGERVAFYVNGRQATLVSTWDGVWHDDRTPHQVTLSTVRHTHWGEAWSGAGSGLILTSRDDHALKAISQATVGARYGVYAASASGAGRGIYGKASAPTGVTSGIKAESHSMSGRGIYAYAMATTGPSMALYGLSRSTSGHGVAGIATAPTGVTIGVLGRVFSPDGRAVYGYATAGSGKSTGVMGESKSTGGRGVFGYASAPNGSPTGVYGTVRSRDGWAGAFVSSAGNGVLISVPTGKIGLTVARGTKNAVVSTSRGARLLYAEESTGVWFSDYGFGRLRNGRAVVSIDNTFKETVNLASPYYVFLEPYGDADLYISKWDAQVFEVRSREPGADIVFGYRIVAKRRGFENKRLERVPWTYEDFQMDKFEEPTWNAIADLTPAMSIEAVEMTSTYKVEITGSVSPHQQMENETDIQGGPNSVGGVTGTHTHWGESWGAQGIGLTVTSTDGNGIQAMSNATTGPAIGAYGSSASSAGSGVCGVATSSTGPAFGAYALVKSPQGRAVYGYTSATSGPTAGIVGEAHSTTGRGIYAYANASSGTTYGVFGMSRSPDGRGVYGHATATTGTTYGIYGISRASSGKAVYGYAMAGTGTTYGVYGEVRSPTGWAARFITRYGNGVYISVPSDKVGLNVVGGTKNAVVATSEGARLLYAEEATEVWFSDYGFAQTQNGTATVAIDPVFAETVNLSEPYHVFIQPYGDANLYVVELGRSQFKVRVREGARDVPFAYRIVAKRKGHEDKRLEKALWAEEDANLYTTDGDLLTPERSDEQTIDEQALNLIEPEESEGKENTNVRSTNVRSTIPERLSANAHTHWGDSWTGTGTGLRLTSVDNTPLKAISQATTGQVCGLYGESRSTTGRGVYGLNKATSGYAVGLYGYATSTSGRGVYGVSTSTTGLTYGIYAIVRSPQGRALFGYANASSGTTVGVYGESASTSGRGVYGYAAGTSGGAVGIMGVTRSRQGIGVYGLASASTGNTTGIYGTVRSPTGWAARFISAYGNGVYISVPNGKRGLNVVGGTKNALVWTSDGARLLYAEESTEVWFADYGFVRAENGEAEVRIDPLFAETVNLGEPYHVSVQAYGNADVYVASREQDRFVVRVRTGDPNVLVGYRIVAKRRGYEDKRLERAPWADSDPNLK